MAKKQTDSTQKAQTPEDVLDQLAFLAQEDVRLRDESMRKEKNKQEGDASGEPQNGGKKKKKRKSKKEAAPQKDDFDDNPFAAFAEKMNEGAKALERKEQEQAIEEEEMPSENDPEPEVETAVPEKKSRSKDLRGKERRVGEEVTKEHAENLIAEHKSNRELGGRRATIIVHRTVINASGETVKDEYLTGDEPEQPEQEEAVIEAAEEPAVTEAPEQEQEEISEAEPETKPEPEQEEKCLLLIRVDTGEAFALDEDLTIGREDDNDIVIPEPDGHYVSGRHAEVYIKGKDTYIRDSGSTNGTFVNGSRIGSKRLRVGQKVRLADIEFTIAEE